MQRVYAWSWGSWHMIIGMQVYIALKHTTCFTLTLGELELFCLREGMLIRYMQADAHKGFLLPPCHTKPI